MDQTKDKYKYEMQIQIYKTWLLTDDKNWEFFKKG
jgi:hypothetical protein